MMPSTYACVPFKMVSLNYREFYIIIISMSVILPG